MFDMGIYLAAWMAMLLGSWVAGWITGFIVLSVKRFLEQV